MKPVLLNVLSTAWRRRQHTLKKSAKDPNLGDAVSRLTGQTTIQRNVDNLKDWANTNLIKLNHNKCKVLHLGQTNPLKWWKCGDQVCCEGLVVLKGELHMRQQVEGRDYAPLLSTRSTTSKISHPILGPPIKSKQTKKHTTKTHKQTKTNPPTLS